MRFVSSFTQTFSISRNFGNSFVQTSTICAQIHFSRSLYNYCDLNIFARITTVA